MTSFRNFTFLVLLVFSVGLLHAQTPIDIAAQLTFTAIDVPGARYTGVWGINSAGDTVGNYGQDINSDSHGFLYSNGTFTYFDYPGQSVTVPRGVNDSGVIVGYAGKNPVLGFTYNGTNFAPIRHGGDSATYSDGINNVGEIVGATGTIYTTKGFDMRVGHFKALRVPGQYIYVSGSGVNNIGTIVGWADSSSFRCRAGNCKLFDFPGAIETQAMGVNDGEIIVGWYEKGPPYGFHSFALMNGRYTSFDYPGAQATFAIGINTSGQIVGEYTDDFSVYHGFVTSPISAVDFR